MKITIARKIISMLLTAGLVPLIIVGYMNYTNAVEMMRDEIKINLVAIAEIKSNHINSYFENKKRDVESFSKSPVIMKTLPRLVDAFNDGGIESAEYDAVDSEIRAYLKYHLLSHEYYDLFLISISGDIVFTVVHESDFGTNLLNGPYRDSELAKSFSDSAANLETVISNFRHYEPSDEPGAFLATPIYNEGVVIGVLGAQLSTNAIYELVQEHTGLGSTGETVIVSKIDDRAVFLNPLRHDPNAAFNREVAIGSTYGQPVQQAVQGLHGNGIFEDYRGVEVLAAWDYIPHMRLGMVVKQDTDEAYAPVYTLRRQSVLIGVITFLFIIPAALFFARSISIPIKGLTTAAKSMAGGDLTAQASVYTEDEIGTLGRAFNTMAEVLGKKQHDLIKTNEELEQTSQYKSEFLANMSHEIRTPMNGVIGMTDLLLLTKLDVTQRRYTETVKTSADSLLGVINDILVFSKSEAGKLEIDVIDFNLRTMMEDFPEMIAFKAQEKGLEFICVVESDVPALLRGDPGRLRQILVNLTGNAVKFTQSGEIVVRARLQSETEEEVVLCFSVSDTGIGLPDGNQDYLFDLFTQVDTSTTRKYGGTGLGLAICKQLVELMGGEIGVNSEDGKGAEFWFTACFQKQSSLEEERLPLPDMHGGRVLIVDDNATNREILLVQLASWGIRRDEAPDGEAALQCLHKAAEENDPYHIAILDFHMPGMDGEELGRKIKADDQISHTELLMMTSVGQRGDADKFNDIGFTAYFTKPVRQRDLFDCLALVLSSQTSKSEDTIITRHSIPETGYRKTRVLLVEDNVINQEVARGILEALGISLDIASNGAEAVTALENTPYDMVLMDCQMPVMDGYEATASIRDPESNVLNHAIPIVAMTANAMHGDREKCIEAGMNDYLSKPINPNILVDMLNQWGHGTLEGPGSTLEGEEEPGNDSA